MFNKTRGSFSFCERLLLKGRPASSMEQNDLAELSPSILVFVEYQGRSPYLDWQVIRRLRPSVLLHLLLEDVRNFQDKPCNLATTYLVSCLQSFGFFQTVFDIEIELNGWGLRVNNPIFGQPVALVEI